MKKTALAALGIAQFVMVLDQSVMNVSISQLVADFDTTVPTIQAVITLYCLVMAMLMLAGGKVADIIGRRRAFVIGLAIYAVGSTVTALSPSVAVLALGWSVLEGIGAALVLPSLAALIAGNFRGSARKAAYAVIGGVAGAGIAVGPIVGGWATTELSWRVVFAGEVVLVAIILALTPKVDDAPLDGPTPKFDLVGAVLSAAGIGTVVLGILQSSTWGFVEPKDSPVEPFGFSLSVFLVIGGALLLWAFVEWQRHREAIGTDPLVHLRLFNVLPLRAGLVGMVTQNLVMMGVFFVVPLYLQLVVGLDALDTGIRMLPISIAMFVFSALGSRLSSRVSVRTIVRAGLLCATLAVFLLIGTIDPELNNAGFALSMAVLGIGMGLIVSQLGNIVQSSVDESGRGEAGGLQYTAQQLGSSVGVALIGAIVLIGLTNVFVRTVVDDDRIHAEVAQQVTTAVGNGIDFAASSDIEQAAHDAGLDDASVDAVVDDYESAQLQALKAGLLVTAFLAIASLMSTRHLPGSVASPDDPDQARSTDMTSNTHSNPSS